MSRPREDRRKLLALLSGTSYVSIDEIMRHLTVSQAAAYQVISRLRARGVPIEGVTGVGYRMTRGANGYTRLPRLVARAQNTPASSPFGWALRALRERAGFSMNALARTAGVDPAHVQRAETRGIGLSREVIRALAAALGAGNAETDRLFVLAGYWPWDAMDDEAIDALLHTGRLMADRAVTVGKAQTA